MTAQQDLQRATDAFRQHLTAQEVRAIDDEPDEGPAGEYKASEYIIFLLALDVYVRHMEETIEFHLGQKQEQLEQGVGDPKALKQEIAELEQHAQNPTDKVIKAGVRLLRRLDRDLATFQKFMSDNLPGQAHQKMLDRALRRPARNTEGAGQRAQAISGLLGLGGAKTTRALFDNQRARKQINEA